MTSFIKDVSKVVKGIPKGETMSYAEVAEAAGYPKAYRAVASVMSSNFDSEIPCHRVIRSDGRPGEYNRGGETKKRAILKSEGVEI